MECNGGLAFSWKEKGGEAKWPVMAPLFDKRAVKASGCESETVSGSSFSYWASPHSLAAAISRRSACVAIFTEVTAILSCGPRSLIDLTSCRLTMSSLGMSLSAPTPLTAALVPWVLDQSVISEGTPPVPKSRLPESSASFIAWGPPSLSQVTLRSPRPSALACFSTRRPSSISIRAR